MNRTWMNRSLSHHENVRAKLYRDSEGHHTIGCGRNLDAVGVHPDEVRLMLANDIARAEADLDRFLPWWRSMSEVRQNVILEMCFNMGAGTSKVGLRSFARTLAAMQEGRYADAAAGMLSSKWARQVGIGQHPDGTDKRATRLAKMMRTNEWPSDLPPSKV